MGEVAPLFKGSGRRGAAGGAAGGAGLDAGEVGSQERLWPVDLPAGGAVSDPPSVLLSPQVIYMARNPKDLVVSYYQFHRSLRTMSYRGTFQEFCRRFMNDKRKCQPWDITAGRSLSTQCRPVLVLRPQPRVWPSLHVGPAFPWTGEQAGL